MTTRYRSRTLWFLALSHRVAHQLSGGRIGRIEPGGSAPRGRTLRVITSFQRWIYRATGGLVGSHFGGFPTLLLTTTGRKTGLARTVPLPYFEHPEGFAVVASFAGNANNPAWYENLVAKPSVELQVGRKRYRATARTATGHERQVLWPRIVETAPNYGDYQGLTTREIPVVVLQIEK